jgi:hypothetical protein
MHDLCRVVMADIQSDRMSAHHALGDTLKDWRQRGLELARTVLANDTTGDDLARALNHAEGSEEFSSLVALLCDSRPYLQPDLPAVTALLPAVGAFLDSAMSCVRKIVEGIESHPEFAVNPAGVRRIFISHGTQDVSLALWFVGALTARCRPGIQVFAAHRDIEVGDAPLRVMLEENLLKADALLALCSTQSHSSPWLWWEASAVWAKGGLVVPLFVDLRAKDFTGPLTLVCQGRQLQDLKDVMSVISTVLRRFDADVGPQPLSEVESSSLTALVGELQPDRHEFSIDRHSIKRPMVLYFDQKSDIELAIKIADRSARLRDVDAAIAALRTELDTVREIEATEQGELETIEDRIRRGGGWAGCSEHLHIHGTRVSYCKARAAAIRERIEQLVGQAMDMDRELTDLEHPRGSQALG